MRCLGSKYIDVKTTNALGIHVMFYNCCLHPHWLVFFCFMDILGLWGLVNNAGILQFTEVELCPLNVFQQHFDVNCLGQVRMVKAFLPLIKRSKGRIVNFSSMNGKLIFIGIWCVCVGGYGGVGVVCVRTCIQSEDNNKFNTVKVRTFLQREDKIHFECVDAKIVLAYTYAQFFTHHLNTWPRFEYRTR